MSVNEIYLLIVKIKIMEDVITDEIIEFIETKIEDLNDDSKESIINKLEDYLSELESNLSEK